MSSTTPPGPDTTDPRDHIRAKTIAGVRTAVLLNVATIPLSFVTNMIFGRASEEALGAYGAVTVFVGSFLVFFSPGGREVFTRLLPKFDEGARWSFLVTYGGGVLALFLVTASIARWLVPDAVDDVLARFAMPSFAVAFAFGTIVILWAFFSHFLYGVLEGGRAALSLRMLVVGFFVFALLTLGPFRDALATAPGTAMWHASLAVYGSAGILGLVGVLETAEFRRRERLRPRLHAEFPSVVLYTHAATVISFVYQSLVPAVVLVWLDLERLGRLHAAMRYGAILGGMTIAAAPVIAPGLSRLVASGHRESGLRQASTAVRLGTVLLFPACAVLMFFAGDAMAVIAPSLREHRDLLRYVCLVPLAGPMMHVGTGLAVATGVFRTYLAASTIFVISALAMTAALVPTLGVLGAALAAPAAAATHATCLALALRWKVGFHIPRPLVAAWGVGAAAAFASTRLDLGRPAAVLGVAVTVGAFAVLGNVHPREILELARRLRSRR